MYITENGEAMARLSKKAPPSEKNIILASSGWDLANIVPSVGVLRCSKNRVDARKCFFQQRAKSLNLAGA